MLSSQNPGLDEKIEVILLSTLPFAQLAHHLFCWYWLAHAFEYIRSGLIFSTLIHRFLHRLQECPVHSGFWMGCPESPRTLLLSQLEEGRHERGLPVCFLCVSFLGHKHRREVYMEQLVSPHFVFC